MTHLRTELEQCHRSLDLLYEFSPVIYAILNPAGNIIEMNLRGLITFDRPHSGMIGNRFSAFVHPEDRAMFLSHLKRSLQTDNDISTELRLMVKNENGFMPVHMTTVRVQNPRSTEWILPTAMVDLTERRKAEAKLRKREQSLLENQKIEAIGRLAGGVAHDFNNLITGIIGISQSLHDDKPSEFWQEDLEEIIKACHCAFGLTRQLLAFSRQQVIHPVAIDLNQTAKALKPMLQRLIGEGIELQTALCSRPAVIKADEGQMEQVLTNLVINARDAIPGGGTILIEIDLVDSKLADLPASGTFVRLRVSDTGTGMSDEVRTHIF